MTDNPKNSPHWARTVIAGKLFKIAVESAKGIIAGVREGGQSATLVSIVFAVSALEAFLNESTAIAKDCCDEGSEPDVVRAFVQLLEEAEESRASPKSKLQLAHWMLIGKPADWGAQPFQDVSVLLDIRNDLMHLRSKELVVYHSMKPTVEATTFYRNRAVERLRSKNILADFRPEQESSADWTLLIGTKAVAMWGCNTIAGTVLYFSEALPRSNFKRIVRTCYEPLFKASWK